MLDGVVCTYGYTVVHTVHTYTLTTPPVVLPHYTLGVPP